MNGEKIYYISWKGEESGAYNATEIRNMLNTGKIGYLHLIRTKESKWIPIKDANLDALPQAETVPQIEKKSDSLPILLYGIAGLTFLSAWIFLVSALLSIYIYTSANDKRNAIISLIVAATITLSGIIFFDIVYPTIAE